MRTFCSFCLGVLCLILLAGRVWADDFELLDGTKVSGEVVLPASADGLNLKIAGGKYQKIAWDKFSQASLQEMDKNPKLAPFVDGLIEPPEVEREKKTEVEVKPVDRLNRPTKGSIIGGLFHAPVGIFCLIVIYAASLYAAYEIAVVRTFPVATVCGVSAIAPVIGQIIFLCLPARMTAREQRAADQAQAQAEVEAQAQAQPLQEFHTADENAGGLHLSHAAEATAETSLPETQIFARGKFTFNRRFFETKFAGYFGVVRREGEKNMILVIKTARGEYETTRISRITSNEMHLDVRKGGASQEVAVPFGEISEVKLKHKDAP